MSAPAHSGDPDVAAMDRLRDGDDLALNEIMERWHRRLVSFLLRFTGSEAIACDLAQETFVRIYQSRGRYKPTGAFSTWLFTIAANLARHHLRWVKRHPAVSLDVKDDESNISPVEKMPAGNASPDQVVISQERTEMIREAISSLPDDLREAIILFEYESLSHNEIAKVAGCSSKAVETRLYRAREILRNKLSRWL